MEERTGSAEGYRFGFQGQETDDEVYGSENAVSFKYRVHDARIGRFLSIDPLAPEYPFYSPYAFSGNRVIDSRELEGLEPEYAADMTINHTLEESDDGSGPTHLALRFGNMEHWRIMVDDPRNERYFGDIREDRYNPNNPAYRELNLNVGDKVYNVGTYSVASSGEPVENSGWQSTNANLVVGGGDAGATYGVGIGASIFRAPVGDCNCWEANNSFQMVGVGVAFGTPGVEGNIGVGSLRFNNVLNSSYTETLNNTSSLSLSVGANYVIGAKYLYVKGYKPEDNSGAVWERPPVYRMDVGFFQLGTPGVGGSLAPSEYSWSSVRTTSPIDSPTEAMNMHLRYNVDGTNWLLKNGIDTARNP